MGYYSFYKIIKDLIYMIFRFFKKSTFRLFTIIIIFFIVFTLLSFKNKSSAHVSFFDSINSFINTNVQYGSSWALYYGYDDNIYLCSASNNNWLLSTSGDTILYSPSNSQNNIIQCYYYKMNSDYTFTQVAYDYGYNLSSTYAKIVEMIDINDNIYVLNNNSSYSYKLSDYLQPIDINKNPFIVNDNNSIINWNFDYLIINSGTVPFYYTPSDNQSVNIPSMIDLLINYNGIEYVLDCNDYIDWDNTTSGNFVIKLPKPYVTSRFNFTLNSNIKFTLILHKYLWYEDSDEPINYELGTYNFILAQDTINNINDDSSKYNAGLITKNLERLDSNFSNPNVTNKDTNSFSTFNEDLSINDNTSIDTIFNNIYTAFTTKYNNNNVGVGYTLHLPVPHSHRTIDISPHTIFGRSIYDAFEDGNEYEIQAISILYPLMTAIWTFFIGMYILKDARSIINSVAEGNIENVGSDIKKEIL